LCRGTAPADPLTVNAAVPVYRAESPAVLYITKRIKDGDLLIGSHYVFVRPEAGDFVDDDTPVAAVYLKAGSVREIAPDRKDREKILSIKMTGAFLKRSAK